MAFLLGLGRPPVPRPILVLAFCGLAASFLNAVLLVPGHGVFGVRQRPSLRPPGAGPAFLHAVRLLLLAAGDVILVMVLATHEQGSPLRPGGAPAMLLAVFVLAVAGEVSGRFLFYGPSGRRK